MSQRPEARSVELDRALQRVLDVGPQVPNNTPVNTYPEECWRAGCTGKVRRDDLLGLCPNCGEEMRTW